MGGKFFKEENGNNPCRRIPTNRIGEVATIMSPILKRFFQKVSLVTNDGFEEKEDHGDIDFVVLGEGTDSLREFCDENNIQHGSNGPMEHLAFPCTEEEENRCYQIDVIVCGNQQKYDNYVYFYSKPIYFNSVVGQFARSLGYLFSSEGFFLLVTDARKQRRRILLTENIDIGLEVMILDKKRSEQPFKKPKDFAEWICSSPRFFSHGFVNSHNVKSHRDAKRNDFCSMVYDILDETLIAENKSINPGHIDFSENPKLDLNSFLNNERLILGDDVGDRVLRQLEEFEKVKKPLIRGNKIMDLGIPQGHIIGEILQDVAKEFDGREEEDGMEEKIIEYVKEKYQEEIGQ